MAAYNKCLQITFILVQVAFSALGVVMIAVGSWLEVEERSIVAAIENRSFLYGPYLIIAAGCAVVVVSGIGIVGALCDKKVNRLLLTIYIVLVIVIFVVQLIGGILGFVYRDQIMNFVSTGLANTLDRYAGSSRSDNAVTASWDFVQENADCCGIDGVSDWLNTTITFLDGGDFPASCCLPIEPTCNINSTTHDNVRPDGCITALTSFLSDQLLIVAAIGIAFIIGEIVVVLIAFCLVCCTDFDDD